MRWLMASTVLLAGLALCLPAAELRAAKNDGAGREDVASPSFPDWAYAWDPDYKAPPVDDILRRVPNSSRAYSIRDARNLFQAPDWHPADHPAMPPVVARGRRPAVRACGVCHRAEGTGGPENSSLAGLPASYIIQQMADFKSGARRFSGPRRSPVVLMIQVARATTDAEVAQAAAYFSALRPKRTIDVVETDSVPPTYIAGVFYAIKDGTPAGAREPLGRRIIEVPIDVRQFELRDTRSRFRAYVPPGSLARGETIVRTPRSGTTVTCGRCHGADLNGTSQVPGIAGRSPSYIFRQLYDFKHGVRRGQGRGPMVANVATLSDDDLLAVAAYLASL